MADLIGMQDRRASAAAGSRAVVSVSFAVGAH